jgi:hypothetical protein
MDQLSGGKQHNVPLDRANELFHEAVTFLSALLSGIDVNKLNP